MLYRSSVEYDMGVSVQCEPQKVGVASMFAQTYPSSLRNKFSSIEYLITIWLKYGGSCIQSWMMSKGLVKFIYEIVDGRFQGINLDESVEDTCWHWDVNKPVHLKTFDSNHEFQVSINFSKIKTLKVLQTNMENRWTCVFLSQHFNGTPQVFFTTMWNEVAPT